MTRYPVVKATDELLSLQSIVNRISSQVAALDALCGQIGGDLVICPPARLEAEIKMHLSAIRDDVLEALGEHE